ncbi:partial heptose III glucuronosyltransferase, partial [Anaerolineae bacterium]
MENKIQAGQTLPPVSVVIPAFNEAGHVHEEVTQIVRVLHAHGIVHEIIVVDDGSQDQTAARALQAGARVLQHRPNRGYGASLKTGIIAARYDAIVITDADGTYPAEEIPTLLAQLQTADM